MVAIIDKRKHTSFTHFDNVSIIFIVNKCVLPTPTGVGLFKVLICTEKSLVSIDHNVRHLETNINKFALARIFTTKHLPSLLLHLKRFALHFTRLLANK